jgi:phosphomevalonate kinase
MAWNNRTIFITESHSLVDEFVHAPIRVFAELYHLLSTMAQQANISYITENIQHIVALAQEYGGAAKPSGAGGGDCVVALFSDETQRIAFQKKCPFPSIIAAPSMGIQIISQTNTTRNIP